MTLSKTPAQKPSQTLAPFNEDAIYSAENFRLLMEAMARPGKVLELPTRDRPSIALNAGSILTAVTLCDHETPIWLEPALETDSIVDFLRFECASPIVDEKDRAMFAFFQTCPLPQIFAEFAIGTPAYPDQSTTLILQVDGLSEQGPLSLTGPGIKSFHKLRVDGLASGFWNWWRENTARFPLGLDVILTTETQISALPRTVKIEEIG